MSVLSMSVCQPFAESRRFGRVIPARAHSTASDVSVLAGIGVLTAVARGFANLNLGIPGHSIVLVVVPFTLGLAYVPRRMAGAVMGASALGTGCVLALAGVRGIGAGALTSLGVTAFVLEVALRLARDGRGIYLWCLAAGLASNMVAFLVRAGVKEGRLTQADLVRPFSTWWPGALPTYLLCGALAGAVAASLAFRLRERDQELIHLGKREIIAGILCVLTAGLVVSAVGRSKPKSARVGAAFSTEVGRRVGQMAASGLTRRSGVIVISGELEGTHSVHRQAELEGLREELKGTGVKVLEVVRPRGATDDVDAGSGGASAGLLLVALGRQPEALALVCFAGLPSRVPDGFAGSFGERTLIAYEQNPDVARRWLASGIRTMLLVRGAGSTGDSSELSEWLTGTPASNEP